MRAGTTTMGAKSSKFSEVLEDSVPRPHDACISELEVHPVYALASRINRARFETAFLHGSLLLQPQKQHWHALKISIWQRHRLNLISKGQLYVALVKRLAFFPNKSAGIRAIIPSKRDESIAVKLAFCIASQHRFCGLFFNSSPECSATLSEHTDWITSVAFHPSGCYIATCSRDKTIRLWRLNRGGTAAQCVSTIRVDTPASHELTANFSITAQFHPSAPYIAIASEDGISLWRLDKDCVKAKSTLRLPTKSRVRNGLHSVAFHPSAPYLATTSADGVYLWRLEQDCTAAQCISLVQGQRLDGNADVVHSMAFHPSAPFLATGTGDGKVKLWRLSHDYSAAFRVQELQQQQHHDPIYSVVFHASMPLIATACSDGTANIWSLKPDCSEATHITTIRGHSYSVYSVAFHPSAPFLVTGSGDGLAKLWFVSSNCLEDCSAATCVSTMQGLGGPVRAVAFHPSAACIATGSDFGGVKLWR